MSVLPSSHLGSYCSFFLEETHLPMFLQLSKRCLSSEVPCKCHLCHEGFPDCLSLPESSPDLPCFRLLLRPLAGSVLSCTYLHAGLLSSIGL